MDVLDPELPGGEGEYEKHHLQDPIQRICLIQWVSNETKETILNVLQHVLWFT